MEPLEGLVVVEYAGTAAGAYCAKLFADRGATLLVVGEGTTTNHQRAYMHQRAQRCAADEVDHATVDVVIESSAPAPLVERELDAPQAIRVQISPFGTSGPRSRWQGTDLTDYAISGHMYLYGDPDREPLRGPPDQPAIAAGLYAFIGAMAGLFARCQVGHGQKVDVSHVQVMAALHQVTLLRWIMTRNIFRRMGNRYTGPGQPNGPYPCADGWVSIAGVTEPQVEGLLAVTGLSDLMNHPDIDSPHDFQSHPELLDLPLMEWLRTQKVAEVVDLFQAMRIPTAPLLTMGGLLEDPQLVDRGFLQPLDGPGSPLVPGMPFTLSHYQERTHRGWTPGGDGVKPLAGLRVLDLARVWAGPLCARTLSDLGAEVVWLEAPWSRGPRDVPQSMIDAMRYFPDDDPGERPWNRNTHLVKYSMGKRSLGLDLATVAGREVLARLVPHFHVLIENYSPRVMPQFGFDETRLHQLNSDLIYLTMPGYGRSGPAENWLAYGSSVDSHAGLSYLIGYRDQVPWKGGVAWPDPVAGLHAASAVLGALWAASQRGKGGLTIEAAQFESTVAAIGDRVLAAQIDGEWVPDGNREPRYVLQGVYPCRGNDCWIAISAPDHTAAQALADFSGLAHDIIDDHDAFDTALALFTAAKDAHELATSLQAAGVPAAAVFKAPEVMDDEHLAARGAFFTVDQPDVGDFTVPHTPIAMSYSSADTSRPAPTLGQDNDAVLIDAGFSRDEIEKLAATDVIATQPPL